jgi:thiol-disulfide isomerase/thioredoxin
MKFIYLFVILIATAACKEQATNPVVRADEPKRYADVDTSSNDVVHMNDLNDYYHSLDDIIASNKGKVIYMDIWASWCGPCKAQMPASHQLQEKYKNQDVVFVYVSIDRNNKAWEASAKHFDLMQNSFLARNYPKAKLFQKYDVMSIPRYMLFDKNGRLVDSNANRPSSDMISSNIDAFLSI